MRNALSKFLAALVLLTILSDSAQAQSRIATMDLRKVFDNYWKRKQADAAVKERAAEMEREHTTMVADWRKSKDEYQAMLTSANDQAVSNDEREKRKKAAEDKLRRIKETEESIAQYEKTARTTLDEQLKRMRENILTEIRSVVNAKAAAGNYTLVLDTAAETINNTPMVLFSSSKESDITDAVLAQLNATAPSDPAAAAPAKDDANQKKGKK